MLQEFNQLFQLMTIRFTGFLNSWKYIFNFTRVLIRASHWLARMVSVLGSLPHWLSGLQFFQKSRAAFSPNFWLSPFPSPMLLWMVHTGPFLGQSAVTSPGNCWWAKVHTFIFVLHRTLHPTKWSIPPSDTPVYFMSKNCGPRNCRYLQRWQNLSKNNPGHYEKHSNWTIYLRSELKSKDSQIKHTEYLF